MVGDWFAQVPGWVLPALGVLFARMAVELVEVARVTFTSQGRRWAAATSTTVVSALWVTVIATILTDLKVSTVVAYAIGAGAGSQVGMWLLAKARLGLVTVRVFVPHEDGTPTGDEVADAIRALGVGATVFTGKGKNGAVDMVLSTVRRRTARLVVTTANAVHPAAFTAVDNAPAPGSRVGGLAGPRKL